MRQRFALGLALAAVLLLSVGCGDARPAATPDTAPADEPAGASGEALGQCSPLYVVGDSAEATRAFELEAEAICRQFGVRPVQRHHHERWDGKGYPGGLVGEQTPYMSRILAVADAVEAMCAPRRYRPPMSAAEVLAEVRRSCGTQFAPAIVERAWPVIEETVRSWCGERDQMPEAAGSYHPKRSYA